MAKTVLRVETVLRNERPAVTHQSSLPAESDILHVDVPATPENVGHARHTVADFLHRRAWSSDDADALLLAVGEACNNAVNYGGRGCADPRLIISCLPLDSHRLQIDIRNQGNSFHPDLSECGLMPDSDFATHGRGFGLMLALVDNVQVLSEGENTIVRLTKSKIA